MSAWWLVALIPLAFLGTLWWRRRIERAHTAFRLKMDLAADEDHARQKIQAYYNRQSQLQQDEASRQG